MSNEKRLIVFDDIFPNHCFYVNTKDPMKSLDELINRINNAPTVDAVEVAHGRWVCVNEDENVWMCDGIEGCGGEMIILEKTPLDNGFHFCPYCGADMRGGDGNA